MRVCTLSKLELDLFLYTALLFQQKMVLLWANFSTNLRLFLQRLTSLLWRLYFLGDFNVQIDVPPWCLTFPWNFNYQWFQWALCWAYNKKGNTLDLIIAECEVLPSLRSGHNLIRCTINHENPKAVKIKSTLRNIKAIDEVSFANDFFSHLSDLDLSNGSVDEMFVRFDTSIMKVLDSHRPLQQHFRNI